MFLNLLWYWVVIKNKSRHIRLYYLPGGFSTRYENFAWKISDVSR